jgi:sulfonate transport system permease protein
MTDVIASLPKTRPVSSGRSKSVFTKDLAYRAISYLSPAVLILTWELLAQAGVIPTRVLPAPSAVMETGWRLILTGELQANLLVSFLRAVSGLVIGATVGLILGVIVGFWRLGDALLDRSLQMIRAVPFFAILPMIIIWFGVGEAGKLFLVAKAVMFPIYLNTVLGIRQVDPKLLELARVMKLTRSETIFNVILPGALPSILSGLRMSITISWLALIVAETIGARSGLGFLATDAREYLRTDVIVLTIVIYAVIGILSDVVARKLEASLLSWHPNYARRSG